MTTLWSRLEKNWRDIIGVEFDRSKMEKLVQFLQREKAARRTIYPKDAEIFNALNLTPFENIKVVIIGQDPYHGEGQAHGLCFSVPKGIDIPRSLRNIYEEIDKEYDPKKMPCHGDLTGWAKQGVLLLNATLTVRKGEPRLHRGKGWEEFTDAQKKRKLIVGEKHRVLEASHPSGFSAHRALRGSEVHSFRGCGHFSTANQYLIQRGLKPIDWQKI